MTQRYSQNGWPAYESTKPFVRKVACGFGFWAANADMAVVLAEFVSRFDIEVEEITGPVLDDWSYNYRTIRDQVTGLSNHSSATAIDLNALKHPRGVKNTFSGEQQRAMHRIRDSITDNAGRPVLRLGMDYSGTVDDMHVEADAGPARIKQAADKLRRRDEEAMELTKQNLLDIGEAVVNARIENRNESTPDSTTSLGKSQSDVEATQDHHGVLIRGLVNGQDVLNEAVGNQSQAIADLTTLVTNQAAQLAEIKDLLTPDTEK